MTSGPSYALSLYLEMPTSSDQEQGPSIKKLDSFPCAAVGSNFPVIRNVHDALPQQERQAALNHLHAHAVPRRPLPVYHSHLRRLEHGLPAHAADTHTHTHTHTHIFFFSKEAGVSEREGKGQQKKRVEKSIRGSQFRSSPLDAASRTSMSKHMALPT